ncbi:MAG TPA: hypothetical protein VGO45_05755 [Bacteroidia bacterium]|jgi:hypothetical protein|nr:hypothetical protein [Bacteroidia bacterium]
MKKCLILIIIFVCAVCVGCRHDNYAKDHPAVTPAYCDSAKTISFVNDVLPIFQASCISGCHSTSAAQHGVILDTWTGTRRPASNGQLLLTVNHSQPNGTGNVFWMPYPNGSLSACQIAIITKWVNAGYLNN